jgi:hypothetical protein
VGITGYRSVPVITVGLERQVFIRWYIRVFLFVLSTSPPPDPTPRRHSSSFPNQPRPRSLLLSLGEAPTVARPIPGSAPPVLSRPQMCQPAHPQESQHMFQTSNPSLILMLYRDALAEQALEGKEGG